MNARLQYEIRGWAYWAKCLNPLRDTITIKNLPLGLRLQAYKRDAVGRGLYRRKIHEPSLTKFLLSRFARFTDRNFIDVGSNIGYFTCLLSKLAGQTGKVLSIEPGPPLHFGNGCDLTYSSSHQDTGRSRERICDK